MANVNEKHVTVGQVLSVKTYLAEQDTKALKSIAIDAASGDINFYKTEDGSGDPAYTVTVADFIKDKYLDTTKTTVVNEFAWSETTYPKSTNPNLDGKPVVVFAVANGDETIYSFASLAALIDVYEGVDGTTANVTVSATNKITVDVKVSAEADNVIETKADGLYVNVSGKIAAALAENTATDEEFKTALGLK